MSNLSSRRWIVAQIGARRHYAVPTVLQRAGMLERLYTDLCATQPVLKALGATVPSAALPAGLKKALARDPRDVPPEKVRCFPAFALRRMFARRNGRSMADSYQNWLQANRKFNRLVVRAGFGEANSVYVFNGAGLEILQAAKRLGLQTVVDQTDAPVVIEETLLAQERLDWPGWEEGDCQRSDWAEFADREQAEWELADRIICGSANVRTGIDFAEGPVERGEIVPYGFEPPTPVRLVERSQRRQRLRILFAGTLCLRKGIQYVWDAARLLNNSPVRFRAVGPSRLTAAAMRQLGENVELAGALPRSQMHNQYEWADVLVLPSLSEGSANVCYEALAYGLPVITTENAGSVVRDGLDGVIVPIRDGAAIAQAITALASDRDRLSRMSRSAFEQAAKHTWEDYQERLLRVLHLASFDSSSSDSDASSGSQVSAAQCAAVTGSAKSG